MAARQQIGHGAGGGGQSSGTLSGRASLAAPRLPGAVAWAGDRRCRRGGVVAAGTGAGMAVLEEAARRNPALSESYRPAGLPRPNCTVLEAQGRVCTGPEQTRPLGEEHAMLVLDTILCCDDHDRKYACLEKANGNLEKKVLSLEVHSTLHKLGQLLRWMLRRRHGRELDADDSIVLRCLDF